MVTLQNTRKNELQNFIFTAKRAISLGGGLFEALKNEERRRSFHQEEFSYTNNYFLNRSFEGSEQVTFEDLTIWEMKYSGSMTLESVPSNLLYAFGFNLERKINTFLRSVLTNVPPVHPYRGPEKIERRGHEQIFIYSHRFEKDASIDDFKGQEEITWIPEINKPDTYTIFKLAYAGRSTI